MPATDPTPGASLNAAEFARAVAVAFEEAMDVDAALETALRLVCERDGWALGQAWMPRADGSGLQWRAGWVAEPRLTDFVDVSRAIVFAADVGLPGRVWSSRRIIALPDLDAEPEFYRSSMATALGLRAAVAVPLLDGAGVPAVLEFLAGASRAPGTELLDLVGAVTPPVVALLRRRRENAQRETEERIRGLFESPTIGMVFWERDGRVLDANEAFLAMVGYSREELEAGLLTWDRLSPPGDRLDESVFRQIETTGVCAPFEKDCVRSDGRRVTVLVGGGFAPDNRGAVCYVLDVTEQRCVRDALRESEERFRTFMDNSPTVAFMKDADGRYVYHNAGWPRVFEGGALGLTDYEIFPREVADALRANDRAVIAGDGPVQLWEQVPTADGVLRDWIVLKFPFEPSPGRRLLGGVALDLTERRRAEAALQVSEERYRSLVEHAPDAIFLVVAERLTFANRAAVRLLGASSPQDIVGRNAFDVVHPDFHHVARERLRLLVERGHLSRPLEQKFVRLDGTPVDVEVFALPFHEQQGVVQVVARDITERKQGEQERARLLALEQAARAESEALSRKLVEAQESERRRIARELHDEIGQMLTGLSLILKSGSTNWKQRAAEAQKLLHDLTARVREMSLDLRPAMLDDLGLLAALLWQLERYTYQTSIRVRFHHFGLDRRFPAEVETAAYRVVQEALTNVARHSRVSEADVMVRAAATNLWLRVSDRGAGFDAANAGQMGSMGLAGMRERVLSLGGELRIESSPGAGTMLTASLPLPAPSLLEVSHT